jgi:ribonuclease-3 family protein
MEKETNLFRNINTKLSGEDVNMLSPLQLAYIGDAVYELFIRTYLLKKGLPVKNLHKEATKYVKAKAQSQIVHILEDNLSEEEKNIVKRGRNAKTNSMPKNADMIDYKYATGLESLMGYLYLTEQDQRLGQLFERIAHIELD